MRTWHRYLFAIGASVVFAAPAQSQSAAPPPSIQAAKPSPPPMPAFVTAAAVAKQLAARGAKVVLFDTRDASEFAVSRIKGAIRLDPASDPDTLLAAHGGKVRDAAVVFYCTTSGRSGPYAEAVTDDLLAAGARSVATLEDGIIAWSNAGLPLVDAKGPTKYVHPYAKDMAKHLRNPALARFEPRT